MNILYVWARMWRHASVNSHTNGLLGQRELLAACPFDTMNFVYQSQSGRCIHHQSFYTNTRNILLLVHWPWYFTTVILPPGLIMGIIIMFVCWRHWCLCGREDGDSEFSILYILIYWIPCCILLLSPTGSLFLHHWIVTNGDFGKEQRSICIFEDV